MLTRIGEGLQRKETIREHQKLYLSTPRKVGMPSRRDILNILHSHSLFSAILILPPYAQHTYSLALSIEVFMFKGLVPQLSWKKILKYNILPTIQLQISLSILEFFKSITL